MRCPYCHGIEDKVVDSRLADSDKIIRRRRECLGCGNRYTTFERLEEFSLSVIKRNNSIEQYNREKILSGLKKACGKRDIGEEVMSQIADDVEEQLRDKAKAEISSREIGIILLDKLKELDGVAYLRFASVYKNFEDASQFGREAAEMEKITPPKSAKV